MNRHIDRKQTVARTTLAVAGVLCLALVPAAVAQDVAQVRAGSGGIDFLPVVEYGGLVLTVSGPEGFHHRAEFGGGEAPSFSIYDQAGGVLPDGSYTWELSVVPTDAKRREALEANRVATRRVGVERLIQFGSFSILDGAVVAGGETEADAGPGGSGNTLATKDQLFFDDVIITGSLCVGFDCANGENFGFDTVRLKENNLRVKFEDTSVGSFPSNDWEIEINDSANGGASYFRVDDVTNSRSPFTIEANTPSNTLYVDSGKRVGIGTSTPVVQLHVKDGNTPTLRLEQDSSSGFAAQTWDVASNETNFFVRDATNGSTLPFRIRPGASTSSIDIASNGNVGIGTASPSEELDVKSDGTNQNVLRVTRSSDTNPILRAFETSNGGGLISIFDGSNNEDFRLSAAGDSWLASAGDVGIGCTNPDADLTVGGNTDCNTAPFSKLNAGDSTFTTSSSRTMKENLEPVAAEGILDRVSSIHVYEYDFIGGPTDRLGLMAEDFHQVFGRGSEKMLSGQEVQMALWLAVQELASVNDELEAEVHEKDQIVADLEARLARLEGLLDRGLDE